MWPRKTPLRDNSPLRSSPASGNTVHLAKFMAFCMRQGQEATGVAYGCGTPSGARITDYISLGVITRTFPLSAIGPVLAKTGTASIRQRDLPAQVVIYYVPSRPGEFHPQPLTDPYVNLSVHTARHSHAPASCENKPSLEVEALPGLPVGQVLR